MLFISTVFFHLRKIMFSNVPVTGLVGKSSLSGNSSFFLCLKGRSHRNRTGWLFCLFLKVCLLVYFGF